MEGRGRQVQCSPFVAALRYDRSLVRQLPDPLDHLSEGPKEEETAAALTTEVNQRTWTLVGGKNEEGAEKKHLNKKKKKKPARCFRKMSINLVLFLYPRGAAMLAALRLAHFLTSMFS